MKKISSGFAPLTESSASNDRFVGLEVAFALVLLLGICVSYSNSLNAAFHFDDYRNIVENPAVRMENFSLEALHVAATESPIPNRPVAYITFALNYWLDRYEVTGYHLANLAIHLLAAFGLFLVALTLANKSRRGGYRGAGFMAASVASLLWALHPVQVQAVTYVVQRMASMAAMFTIWALWALLEALKLDNRWRYLWFGLATVLMILGLATKETAVALPLVVLIWILVARPEALRGWKILMASALAALAGLALGLGLWGAKGLSAILGSPVARNPEQLLNVPRAFFYNLSLLVFPFPERLGIEHPFEDSVSLTEPGTTLAALIALILLLVCLALGLRRRPYLSFPLLWFTLIVLAEAVVVKHNPIFEHRLYLPSMGLFVLVGLGSSAAWSGRWRWPVIVALTLVLGFFGWATHERNKVWLSGVSLWSDAVRNAPGSTRAYAGLVEAYNREGRHEEAQRAYGEAVARTEPELFWEFYFLGKAAFDSDHFASAVTYLSKALALEPGHCPSRKLFCQSLAADGRLAEAIESLYLYDRTCLNHDAQARGVEADRLTVDNLMARSEQGLRLRILNNKGDHEARMSLSGLLMSQERYTEAEAMLRELLAGQPGNAAAWSNLAVCLLEKGDLLGAMRCQREALDLDPSLPSAHFGLAMILREQGNADGAIEAFRRYLKLAPEADPFREAAEQHIERLIAVVD